MANRILILGASGFIGNTIYKELTSYFDVYGTYNTANKALDDNNVMFQFNVEKDNINDTLKKVNPNYIISSLRGTIQRSIKSSSRTFKLYTIKCRLQNYLSIHRKCF